MTTETKPDQHDGFQDLRRTGKYWTDYGERMTKGADLLEALLPDFVRRRYTVSYFYRSDGDKPYGVATLYPVDGGAEDTEAANIVHADVNKLFDWLVKKRTTPDPAEAPALRQEPWKPRRSLDSGNGSISYELKVCDLPDFPQGLTVTFAGLGAGSACHITKKVTGTHEVEDVEYKMVCDDDPPPEPDTIPAEDAKEVVEAGR